MDAEVRRIIGEAYEQTRQLLLNNKNKLDTVCIYFLHIYLNYL